MTETRARTHAHQWEPVTVDCELCAGHPGARCTDEACPLNARPVDITKYGDPRKIEAQLENRRTEMGRLADATRNAYQEWQRHEKRQTRASLDLQALEAHYREVVKPRG